MSKIEVNTVEPQCGTTVTVGKCTSTVAVPGAATVTGIATAGTLKSDTHQAADGGNIINQSGTDITLGASGDTVSLASGASQSGFGRTGTVDWDTASIKAATFSAVSGNGYFCNTSGGTFTVTLPTSPSAGDIVGISDYGQVAGTNKITIGRNSSNIQGYAVDGEITTNGAGITLVYVDGTKGWVPVNDATSGAVTPAYICASSPSVATCGDYKVHTFTGPGTFTVNSAGNGAGSNSVDYLVIAGAGGGGGGESGNGAGGGGGGGGAGGYRWTAGTYCGPGNPLGAGSMLPISATPYAITVGGGGAGAAGHATCALPGTRGSNSIFSSITSTGGGGGGGCGPNPGANLPGGSGGGRDGDHNVTSGTGNTPPVSPPQGNTGQYAAPDRTGAGGGGSGAVPIAPTWTSTGGTQDTNTITGSPVARGGGGGGGAGGGPRAGGTGGGGGAGTGGTASPAGSSACAGGQTSGSSNTGSGGGGKGAGGTGSGGSGGSGIVIIRYKFQ